jgi:ADP-heptose:LPS heptosyltransferase
MRPSTSFIPQTSAPPPHELPIHFFTIFLNGYPFILHHINVFKNLPFEWHWHLLEGVADLKYDISRGPELGGHIHSELHSDGRNDDHTSEYLSELVRQYPDNVTLYTKPRGIFWESTLEMANAPLANIREECLLWQIDADELWTVEQITRARQLFLEQPDKTAAFYFCHYFVGKDLIIITKETFGNYTEREWLRTWRFRPGYRWLSHEPPRLCRQEANGTYCDIGLSNPFQHAETQAENLVFQHFAYVTSEQVRFKELYYGYKDALARWQELQANQRFPAKLQDFFPWVTDNALVATAQSRGLVPLGRRTSSEEWHFQPFAPSTETAKRILFIRPDAIGDNLLAASILPYLSAKYKGAKVTVVCQSHIAHLYEACPFVDGIMPINRGQLLADSAYRNSVLKQLQSLDADIAFNSVYSRETICDLLTIGSGARQTIGLLGNLCNTSAEINSNNNLFYNQLIPSEGAIRLELERHRDCLSWFGFQTQSLRPLVWLTLEDEQFAEDYFLENHLVPEKTIALFAGAQSNLRIWQYFGEALEPICSDMGFTVLAMGTAKDLHINQQNLASLPGRTLNLSGETTLRQSAALLRLCRLAVGAETGLAHIACAVGTANVILVGGGTFGRFIPYSPLTGIVCMPLDCYGCNWECRFELPHCIQDIDPAVVTLAVYQVLLTNTLKPRIFVQRPSFWKRPPDNPRWRWFYDYFHPDDVEVIAVDRSDKGATDGLPTKLSSEPICSLFGHKELAEKKEKPPYAFVEGFFEEEDGFRWIGVDCTLIVSSHLLSRPTTISFQLKSAYSFCYEKFPFWVQVFVDDQFFVKFLFDTNEHFELVNLRLARSNKDVSVRIISEQFFVPNQLEPENKDKRKLALQFSNLAVRARKTEENLIAEQQVRFDEGFYSEEVNFRWLADQATLTICSDSQPKPAKVCFQLECAPREHYEEFPFEVKIFVGKILTESVLFRLSEQSVNIYLDIPAAWADTRIKIVSEESFVPAELWRTSQDTRRLSVQFSWLEILSV